MQPVGVQFNFRSRGAAAKEIDYATAAHHVHCPLPGLGTAHGFNHDVGATALGHADDRGDGIFDIADLHHFIRPRTLARPYLLISFDPTNHFAPVQLGHLPQHDVTRAS